MSYESYQINHEFMTSFGSIKAEEFQGVASPFVPDIDRLESTAPNLNQKVQRAKRALAEVAIAVGEVGNKTLKDDQSFDEQARSSSTYSEIMKYLDTLDKISVTETISPYEVEYNERAAVVLDWFDAIDDGEALRLVQRDYQTTGADGLRERIKVRHSVLRKVGSVYDFSEFEWSRDNSLNNAHTRSGSRHYYFQRTDDGGVGQIVSARSGDEKHLTSPLFNQYTPLLPVDNVWMVSRLEEFKDKYAVQQRMKTTLSLLEALPRKTKMPLLFSDDIRRWPKTQYSFQVDNRSIGVIAYADRGDKVVPTSIGFNEGRSYSSFWVDCDTWTMHMPNHYEGREYTVNTSLIDEVNTLLREELLKHEEIA